MELQTTATSRATTGQLGAGVLERVWHVRFSPLPWDKCFTIDHSLPYEVVEQIAGELGLTLEEVNAALECWRSKMIAAVDAIVANHMAKAKNLQPNMQSTDWAENKELLFKVWRAYDQEHEHEHYSNSMHDKFSIFEYAPGLGYTPEQIRNAIECWRAKLSEAVYAAAEAAAARYAANPYNPSNP